MKLTRKLILTDVLAGAAPSPLFACAACYGKTDSPLASGVNWGIMTLLAVVLSVLTVFLVGFVHLVRKGEAMHQAAVKRMENLEELEEL
jgi:hypothetical protein